MKCSCPGSGTTSKSWWAENHILRDLPVISSTHSRAGGGW